MYNLIDKHVKQPLYKSFEQLEQAVFEADKTDSLSATLELALTSNNISQAFIIGYRCALQSLLPELNQRQWAAMCVSEKTGNHPKT